MAYEKMDWSGEPKKKVVIIGGGIAGALLATIVQNKCDVCLIDPKEYFEIPWANLRSKVDPTVAEKAVINHSEYLTNGRVVTSTAINVTETEVWTSEGRYVPYDYLVIATGHSYVVPRCRRDRLEQFQEDNHKIKSSESILIVGGGPTGVELAAEIAIDYPDKRISLVHNGPRLLEFIGPKAGNKALEWLRSKKVDVLLDQSINLRNISDGDRVYQTSNGDIIKADCYFVCAGKPVGSRWLRQSFLKEFLDRNGRLMVDENFRVGGLKNVFAIGDITDILEQKQGYTAQRHAAIAGKNLKILLKGGRDTKLWKYKGSIQMTMVSLGRKNGVAEFPIATIAGFLPGMIKSKYLFVERTRKQMGLDS
ncbi:uncharacterized protein A4U43_C09F1260 [Asparagus officinalis]|uniref:FAD/NAD(P)-binding domain-containing protein n=1 Tax=Asparagus officinalis TaxID=4686 RepID=A0A5P1E4C2_ASPOF|nr:apoptosis-inducing factor homolog B-like [Asparagus officinalis]ONK57512.1 uncharacterized protein A4U43_C09F1260 [Asparagus officinalis]